MLDLDTVESQFRASVKELPKLRRPDVAKVLFVHDLSHEKASGVLSDLVVFLRTLPRASSWSTIGLEDIKGVSSMLQLVEEAAPDLLVTYRNLFETEKQLPHSLGTYVDMLTQATDIPVLLLPDPDGPVFAEATQNTDRVMVITNRIVGDNRLVNWGLRLVEDGGRLSLAHIEDEAIFERYLEAISKIPGLDTDLARSAIEAQLLKEARSYIDACKQVIQDQHPGVEVHDTVKIGPRMLDYVALARSEAHDIVVMNTRVEDQRAMHGPAYSLAVELLNKPLLML